MSRRDKSDKVESLSFRNIHDWGGAGLSDRSFNWKISPKVLNVIGCSVLMRHETAAQELEELQCEIKR